MTTNNFWPSLGLSIDTWCLLYDIIGPVIVFLFVFLIGSLVRDLREMYMEERYHGTYEIRGRRTKR